LTECQKAESRVEPAEENIEIDHVKAANGSLGEKPEDKHVHDATSAQKLLETKSKHQGGTTLRRRHLMTLVACVPAQIAPHQCPTKHPFQSTLILH